MKTKAEKPLGPKQQEMIERLKQHSSKKPFVPSGIGQESTIRSLWARKLLDTRLILVGRSGVPVENGGDGIYTTFKAGYWLVNNS